ncbi:nitroreductase family deazaflavin-dependent oxidoreductase [Nocardia halotolerans]
MLPKIFRIVGRAQAAVYRRTGGRVGGTWRIGAGFRKPVPTLLLEHRGRRTGRLFTVPLLYLAHGADIIVVASQGGRAEHPQWYRNLLADPDAHIQVGRERRPVRAVVADAERRAVLWPELLDLYADFGTYQSWAEREIPVVILTPR